MAHEHDQVRAAYNRDPEREWQRLDAGAQYRLEHLITNQALARHLPAADQPCHVLDAGGGPGRYTIALAERGYTLTLVDISAALLDLARQRIAEAPAVVRQRVVELQEGSITDLSYFPDQCFDAVICLGGPLSHVVEETARRRALAELRRVAKPGAVLCISVMNRFGAYCSTVQWPSCYSQFFPQLLTAGLATISSGAPTYYFLPEEFVATLEAADLQVERLYGCNGLGAHLQEANLVALMADEERWPPWRELLLSTCDHPMIVGVSNHLLAVARRPSMKDDLHNSGFS